MRDTVLIEATVKVAVISPGGKPMRMPKEMQALLQPAAEA